MFSGTIMTFYNDIFAPYGVAIGPASHVRRFLQVLSITSRQMSLVDRGVDPYGTGGYVSPIFMSGGHPW